MKEILDKAAKLANAQMRVQSFADRRPDRIAWSDRKWEWASLRPENGSFDLPSYKDLEAREKWFYQAMIESPAMFRRSAGAGSLYWLGLRDGSGAYLDGAKTYKLTVPLPVPAKLFWSVTVYDPNTRSEIKTTQGQGRPAFAGRAAGCRRREIDGSVLRPVGAGWSGDPVDPDDAGQGLVHLLPHLRTGATGL